LFGSMTAFLLGAFAALAVAAGGPLQGRLFLLGRRPDGAGGEKSGGRQGGMMCEGEFLKKQIVPYLEEGRKRSSAPKVKADVGEALVQTADDVKDEGAIMNGFAKVAESVTHPFELAAVVGDGEIVLAKIAEFRVEEECPSLAVPEELRLNCEPGGTSNSVADEDNISEVSGDGADNPRLDDTVYLNPVRRSRREGVGEYMVLQSVLADEEEGVAPSGVECRGDVQNHRDKGPNVLDDDRLSVEVDGRCCLVDEKGSASIRNCRIGVEVVLVCVEVGLVRPDVVVEISRDTGLSGAYQGVADARIGNIALPSSVSGLVSASRVRVRAAARASCAA
jgi:hypothetical protein